jgi:hypothetical protein
MRNVGEKYNLNKRVTNQQNRVRELKLKWFQ